MLLVLGLACCAARAAPAPTYRHSLYDRLSESKPDGYCQQCERDCLAGIDGIILLPGEMNDDTIREAVKLWSSNRTAAEAAYGPIATWDTSGVTNMAFLFCVRADWMDEATYIDPAITFDLTKPFGPTLAYFREFCVLSSSSINDDISAWDTSAVTTMEAMFYGASSFNQPIGKWKVDHVMQMGRMFYNASAFNHHRAPQGQPIPRNVRVRAQGPRRRRDDDDPDTVR